MEAGLAAVIRGWHAHVYFDDGSAGQAAVVVQAAADALPVQKGRLHRQPVGPHPRGSCQLAFAPTDFSQVIHWLVLHRDGLTVFVHPETGDELVDHRDRALWIGPSESLNLAMFGGRDAGH
ncbi:MAG: DOPA 4,5-dioxygenase family protein [Burkholderiaceae bacterium]